MTTLTVTASRRAFLAGNGLLDEGVDLEAVSLRVGGPLTFYLRLVKKSAITIGDRVWFVSEEKRDDLSLLAHELVHVGQYARLGLAGFLARYFLHMAKARFRYSRKLPLEAPAYERQALAKRLLAESGPVDL